MKTMMKLFKFNKKNKKRSKKVKTVHKKDNYLPSSTPNSMRNDIMDKIDEKSKHLQAITVRTCSSVTMNNGNNAVHSFVHNEYTDTDSINLQQDETEEHTKEIASIDDIICKEDKNESSCVKENIKEQIQEKPSQKPNKIIDIESKFKALHIITGSDQGIEFYNESTKNSPELSYPSPEPTSIPTQECLPSPNENLSEEMEDEMSASTVKYDYEDIKDELQYPSTPVIKNIMDLSSLPMSNSDALQTIIKYTESAPSPFSNTNECLSECKTSETECNVNNAPSTKPMMLTIDTDTTATAVNPRISNLENMVQKVVVTNVKLMENFSKFMQKYNIDESLSSSCIQSPQATLSSIATVSSSIDRNSNFGHIHSSKSKHPRKRSKSESFGPLAAENKKNVAHKANSVSFQNQTTQIRRPRKYKSDRGPKLSTAQRAIKRQTFDIENKRRIEKEQKEEKRRLKQLQLMEEQIKKEQMKLLRYKARPIKKFKPTKIVLPRRKLKISKVGIYDRGLKLQKEKEDYLMELRRLRDIQMGISVRYDLSFQNVAEQEQNMDSNGGVIPDVAMRCNGAEGDKRLKAMQSLRLRQN